MPEARSPHRRCPPGCWIDAVGLFDPRDSPRERQGGVPPCRHARPRPPRDHRDLHPGLALHGGGSERGCAVCGYDDPAKSGPTRPGPGQLVDLADLGPPDPTLRGPNRSTSTTRRSSMTAPIRLEFRRATTRQERDHADVRGQIRRRLLRPCRVRNEIRRHLLSRILRRAFAQVSGSVEASSRPEATVTRGRSLRP